MLFPSNHAIWGQWAPPLERSRLFSITAAGCPVGTILTMPLTGLLTKYGFDGGWASVFYVFGKLFNIFLGPGIGNLRYSEVFKKFISTIEDDILNQPKTIQSRCGTKVISCKIANL